MTLEQVGERLTAGYDLESTKHLSVFSQLRPPKEVMDADGAGQEGSQSKMVSDNNILHEHTLPYPTIQQSARYSITSRRQATSNRLYIKSASNASYARRITRPLNH
jgi:hypothetical protein